MDQFPWRLIGLKEKEKEKTEKVKEKEEKAKESPREKDMEVTAAEEEKEEDAVAEKEEEKVEKEKVSTLDKWVRKVTAEKVSLVEKEKDLRATSVARQDISPQSVTRILGKEKVKERASGMFMENMSSGTKIMNNGMTNGRIGTTMKEISKANSLRKRQVHRVSQV